MPYQKNKTVSTRYFSDLYIKFSNIGLCSLHEDISVATVADELYTHVTPLLAALDRVGKAADFYALCSCLCDDLLDRGDDLRMVDFTDMTKRAGQIIGADKNYVDAGYVQNFIEVVDRLLTLGLKDDHGVLCTGEILAAGNRAEACRTDKRQVPRVPTGENFAAETAARACSAVSICGIMTAPAPTSRA